MVLRSQRRTVASSKRQDVRINDEVRGRWLRVGKSKRNWLTVERFSVLRGEPVARSRARICLCSWLNQKTRDSEWSSDDAERRVSITGSGVS
mgnify:CR=1 FL=1